MPAKNKNGKPVGKRDYFEIKAVGEDSATIYLFDYVGDWDADAKYFRDALNSIGDVANIDLRINSPGGSVYEGLAIFNLLKAHPAQITVYIDGLAASMASYIAMVGDLIVMPENTMMMIHNPRTLAFGESKDMEKTKEILEKAKSAMIGAYMDKTGLSEEEISQVMDEETWLTGLEAVDMGFADETTKPVDMAACSEMDLSAYFKTPEFLKLSASAGKSKQKEAIMPQAKKPAADNNPVDIEAVTSQAQQAALNAEKERRDGIKAIFGQFKGDHQELLEACLDDMSVTKVDAQAKLLNALGNGTQPTGRITTVKDEVDNKKAGFSAALLARAGIAKDDASNEFRGMTLLEMAKESLSMHGVSTSGMSKMEAVSAAFTHTSSDFGSLLSGAAQKAMMKGYAEAEESFEKFCSVGELSDFKINERVDIGTFPSLRKVRPGAEYKSITLGDRKETMQLATYGEKFSITRQAIINDDLGAFTRLPMKMGMASKRTIGDLVFAILTSNPKMSDNLALFHATHKNLGTGALSSASVDALRSLMRKQKDGDAFLNIRPEFLIVPAALEGTANQVMQSEFEVSSNKNATVPNQVRGMAEVISDARLDDTSAAAFYLMAGMMYDTIEVAYLDGIAEPTIEQQAGWDVDGTEFKVRIDAAVSPLDFRGMAKSSGA